MEGAEELEKSLANILPIVFILTMVLGAVVVMLRSRKEEKEDGEEPKADQTSQVDGEIEKIKKLQKKKLW